jgi:hypothetical protein
MWKDMEGEKSEIDSESERSESEIESKRIVQVKYTKPLCEIKDVFAADRAISTSSSYEDDINLHLLAGVSSLVSDCQHKPILQLSESDTDDYLMDGHDEDLLCVAEKHESEMNSEKSDKDDYLMDGHDEELLLVAEQHESFNCKCVKQVQDIHANSCLLCICLCTKCNSSEICRRVADKMPNSLKNYLNYTSETLPNF